MQMKLFDKAANRSSRLLPIFREHEGWGCDRLAAETPIVGSDFPHTDENWVDHVRARVARGSKVYVGLSGGKDSISCCLLLKELGIPFVAVFADTGWEAKITYTYVKWFCEVQDIELVVVASERHPGGLLDVIRHKGCFPKLMRRFCTEELKEMPISAYLKERVEAGEDVISVAGIRAAESKQRASMAVWSDKDKRFGCDVWHPIFRWSYEDTIAMHHRHHCRPNPLYLLGATRVGCFPCVFAGQHELRIVSVFEPDRIKEISDLEADVDQRVRDRQGDAYEERNYPTSTMFWMSVYGQSRPVLVDDMIERSWKPSNQKEAAVIGDGSLASQAALAKKRWGFSLKLPGLDLDVPWSERSDAKKADYSTRYKTRAELAVV